MMYLQELRKLYVHCKVKGVLVSLKVVEDDGMKHPPGQLPEVESQTSELRSGTKVHRKSVIFVGRVAEEC